VRHAGPGYCVTTWKAEPGHGADYAIDNEWTALKHVDLNHCLMHCWATTNCYCVNFHHDIDHTGHPLNTFNQWMDTGTCFMNHKCNHAKVEKGFPNTEVCFVE